ncbi:MAG TPA: DUF1343 domain-containing protein [Longimicrobiaceae bacterium]|nr:DUF1343 domain-containing protein [Longimicrobiaceae bacterium]
MTDRHSISLPRLALLAGGLLLGGTAACRTSPPPQEAPGEPARTTQAAPDSPGRAQVLPGLEVLLRDSLHLVRGKRVGFITNQSAVTSTGELGIDALARHPEVKLVALFSPEHGIRGTAEAGAKIDTGRDEKTGLPVYSLYGRTQRPTDEMLRDVEILVFDIQDIGARPYTFVWTMAMAMEEAAKRRIPFVVLDRPNPITAAIDGPLMHMDVRNVTQVITGYYAVPLRHGMTVGEIARYYNEDARVGADLHVVPAAGWRGDMWFEETGLPFVRPSPNIRSVDAELKYSGLVLAEATNLTVGRGTEAPFSYLGAPWMDAGRVLERVGTYDLPGVRLSSVRITPSGPRENWIPFRDSAVAAIRLDVTDRNAFRPALTALVLLTEIKRQHPAQFRITNAGFTQMMGSRWAREAFDRGEDPRVIARRWEDEVRQWMATRNRYRLYAAGRLGTGG